MQIKITDIHPEDSFYDVKEAIIGQEGILLDLGGVWGDNGYAYGKVDLPDFHPEFIWLHGFKYEVL